MKVIDFDSKFFQYAREWVSKHPGLNERQIDESYNAMMEEWISRPDPELDGATPATYFDRYTDPAELVELLCAYHASNVNCPEPLYTRIVEMGAKVASTLGDILRDADREEPLRAEVMGILRDIGDEEITDYLVRLVCEAEEQNELCDMAADVLSTGDANTARELMDAYERAPEYAKTLILDIESNFPGDDRITDALVWRLKNRPEERALNASLLKKVGDPRALEALEAMLKLHELSYFDYLEIRDAVDALGGNVGEERTFYGDPDYEAMRSME